MEKLPWGFTEEKTLFINDLVNRYAQDEVIGFDDMIDELAPLLRELHGNIYRRAEMQLEGKPYLADELAGKIILDLYDENGKIWAVTRKCEGKFWYALSRKFKDYYYEQFRSLSKQHSQAELSYEEREEAGFEEAEASYKVVDPEEHAILREMTRQQIEEMKDMLTPSELRVFLKVTVRRHQGYSTSEIASDLGLAESTVTSWYSRIKRRIEDELGQALSEDVR